MQFCCKLSRNVKIRNLLFAFCPDLLQRKCLVFVRRSLWAFFLYLFCLSVYSLASLTSIKSVYGRLRMLFKAVLFDSNLISIKWKGTCTKNNMFIVYNEDIIFCALDVKFCIRRGELWTIKTSSYICGLDGWDWISERHNHSYKKWFLPLGSVF